MLVQQAEIFTLQGLVIGLPQQIVDPTGIDVVFSRKLMNDAVLLTKLSILLRDIVIKLSFQDLILSHSIILRSYAIASSMDWTSSAKSNSNISSLSSTVTTLGSIENASVDTGNVTTLDSKDSSAEVSEFSKRISENRIDADNSDNELSKDTKGIDRKSHNFGSHENDGNDDKVHYGIMYDINCYSQTVSLTIINDYGYQNPLPILRSSLREIEFQLTGSFENELIGQGKLQFEVEYYNPRVTTFEPVVEPWNPRVLISLHSDGRKGM